MRTPAGQECRFYHADFHRGLNVQECRLANENPESLRWRPVDCSNCPVPDILKANASKDLELKLTIKPRLWGLGRKVEVEAYCLRHRLRIDDPYVGCPKCVAERPGLEIFKDALNQIEDD